MSARWPGNEIFPHSLCNTVSALRSSGSLLASDCALMSAPGIVLVRLVRLHFNLTLGYLTRVVGNDKIV